ncbi:hypothetical protein C0991_010859, partial [Blastosporella zonata]
SSTTVASTSTTASGTTTGAGTTSKPVTAQTTATSGSTSTSTTTATAASGTTTLAPGYSFIRAVVSPQHSVCGYSRLTNNSQEDPNFHKYLQSEVLNTASDAVLGSPSTAAQFQITNGQLIQNANGTPLYAIVETPANSTVVKLKMSWSTTPATAGTFVFSGDTVEWSIPTITRPQNNVSRRSQVMACKVD